MKNVLQIKSISVVAFISHSLICFVAISWAWSLLLFILFFSLINPNKCCVLNVLKWFKISVKSDKKGKRKCHWNQCKRNHSSFSCLCLVSLVRCYFAQRLFLIVEGATDDFLLFSIWKINIDQNQCRRFNGRTLCISRLINCSFASSKFHLKYFQFLFERICAKRIFQWLITFLNVFFFRLRFRRDDKQFINGGTRNAQIQDMKTEAIRKTWRICAVSLLSSVDMQPQKMNEISAWWHNVRQHFDVVPHIGPKDMQEKTVSRLRQTNEIDSFSNFLLLHKKQASKNAE